MIATWAADQIGAGGGFSSDVRAIGLEHDGELVAAVMWDYITKYNCVMSVASDGKSRWMSRDFLYRAFYYPFGQLNLRVITCLIAENNAPSLKLCKHIGFKIIGENESGRIPHGSGDYDDIVLCMKKEDCRWISRDMAKHAVKLDEGA